LQSNTAGPRANTTDCRRWRSNWCADGFSVILTGANAAALAAKAATTTIPIVFILAEDPVQLGLVASVARPGGNATGINFVSGELTAKRLELLREFVPAAARVAVLVNPADATATETTLRDLEMAARAIGLKIQVLKAGTSVNRRAFITLLGGAAAGADCRSH
jgi:putative tryptophan/tyrosine transport system substrate-binding protein